MRASTIALVIAAAAITALACDPVHQNAVDALGGNTPGVRNGPLHRPGQPCLLCHDGALGNPPQFSVAGTVYVDADGSTPADGAVVTLTPASGAEYKATTNAAGNFYVNPSQLTPTYPMKVSVTYKGTSVDMTSLVGRDGSCAGCHTATAGPSSAGPVYIPAGGVTP